MSDSRNTGPREPNEPGAPRRDRWKGRGFQDRDSGNPFAPRTVLILVAVALIGFFGLMYSLVLEERPHRWATYGPTSFSYSAIGHRAWYEALRDSGLSVGRSRFASTTLARAGVLVAAQPIGSGWKLAALLSAPRLLVVLPKWTGAPEPDSSTHVKTVALIDADRIDRILEQVTGEEAEIKRPAATPKWRINKVDGAATLDQPQLMVSAALTPVIAAADGAMLVGERVSADRALIVVSDPDVINNAGIGRTGNADLIDKIVQRFLPDSRPGGGVLVFDETIHGLEQAPNLMREALSHPYRIATLLAFTAGAMLFWAATGRFGKPLPVTRDLAFGKTGLIRNMAMLLILAGHHGTILRRYLDDTIRDVAAAYRLPRGLCEQKLIGRLDRIAATRGVRIKLRPLHDGIRRLSGDTDGLSQRPAGLGGDRRRQYVQGSPRQSSAVLRMWRAAVRLHAWKQEMIHGPGRRPRSR